jgi:GTP cyclohydrolase IA
MLPFSDEAYIAYTPDQKIVGLSKLARLLDVFGRRLQVQERLTRQIASELARLLKPKGVAVMMQDQCTSCRGVRKRKGNMIASCLLAHSRRTAPVELDFFRWSGPSTRKQLFQLKPTRWRWSTNAMFFNGRSDYFCEQ